MRETKIRYIEDLKFLTLPEQEHAWDKESSYKCFYCRTDDHLYSACPRMNKMKKLAEEANHDIQNSNDLEAPPDAACRSQEQSTPQDTNHHENSDNSTEDSNNMDNDNNRELHDYCTSINNVVTIIARAKRSY